MIDIHVHILPHLDDGAQILEESLAMAELAAADHIKCMVATPHSGLWGEAISRKSLEDGVDELSRIFAEKGFDLAVLPGAEVYIRPETARQAQDGQAPTLNGSRYMLVELPLQAYPRYTDQVLFELQVKGFKPVLAHPERYVALQDDVELFFRIVERGNLAQVTGGSLLGHFGRKVQRTAETMLERNLLHVIASDAHDADDRRPNLSEAVECAARIVGTERAMAMVTSVPEAIINNQTPTLPVPVPIKHKKGWSPWR